MKDVSVPTQRSAPHPYLWSASNSHFMFSESGKIPRQPTPAVSWLIILWRRSLRENKEQGGTQAVVGSMPQVGHGHPRPNRPAELTLSWHPPHLVLGEAALAGHPAKTWHDAHLFLQCSFSLWALSYVDSYLYTCTGYVAFAHSILHF